MAKPIYANYGATSPRVEEIERRTYEKLQTYGPVMRGGGGDSLYSDSVAIIKKYFNTENIIFTGGATDSLNVLANAWKGGIRVYNNTHTSAVAQCRQGEDMMTIVGVPHSVSGTAISKAGTDAHIHILDSDMFVLDMSQGVGIYRYDSSRLNGRIDGNKKYVGIFSAHKMYGPTGIGCIIGDLSYLESPRRGSGENQWMPGTPNLYGIVGLATACEWMTKNQPKLYPEMIKNLEESGWIMGDKMVPVFAYEILSTEEEIEKLCTEARILARVGLHCAPMDNFGPSLRFSFGLSSTKNDMLACKVFRDILIKNKNIRAV